MIRTLPRHVANAAAGLGVLINGFGVIAYLVTFFNWTLSPEKAVDGDELMDPAPLLIMAGWASVFLLTMVLHMAGIRLEPPAKLVRNAVRYFWSFGLILYLVTAVCFPRHPLRFNGPNIEVNEGKWIQIQPAGAEKFFRNNIRRNIGALIFFGNIAMYGFVVILSAKPKEWSDDSSTSRSVFGVKKHLD